MADRPDAVSVDPFDGDKHIQSPLGVVKHLAHGRHVGMPQVVAAGVERPVRIDPLAGGDRIRRERDVAALGQIRAERERLVTRHAHGIRVCPRQRSDAARARPATVRIAAVGQAQVRPHPLILVDGVFDESTLVLRELFLWRSSSHQAAPAASSVLPMVRRITRLIDFPTCLPLLEVGGCGSQVSDGEQPLLEPLVCRLAGRRREFVRAVVGSPCQIVGRAVEAVDRANVLEHRVEIVGVRENRVLRRVPDVQRPGAIMAQISCQSNGIVLRPAGTCPSCGIRAVRCDQRSGFGSLRSVVNPQLAMTGEIRGSNAAAYSDPYAP